MKRRLDKGMIIALAIIALLFATGIIFFLLYMFDIQICQANCKFRNVSIMCLRIIRKGDCGTMEIEKMKRKTIRRLKEIKSEQGLSVPKIMDLMEERGQFVSESTIKRVFADGSEEQSFRYQDSIAPIADVLLDIYGDTSSLDDAESLRHIIREKNKLIEFLMIKLDEQEAAFESRKSMYEERKSIYDRNIARLEKQIERKDDLIERLLNTYLPTNSAAAE